MSGGNGTSPALPDPDSLPQVQYLILEVLAARARLGEALWTFPRRLAPALDALEKHGFLWHEAGNVPRTRRASLTAAGRHAVLHDGYRFPEDWIRADERQRCANGLSVILSDAITAFTAELAPAPGGPQ